MLQPQLGLITCAFLNAATVIIHTTNSWQWIRLKIPLYMNMCVFYVSDVRRRHTNSPIVWKCLMMWNKYIKICGEPSLTSHSVPPPADWIRWSRSWRRRWSCRSRTGTCSAAVSWSSLRRECSCTGRPAAVKHCWPKPQLGRRALGEEWDGIGMGGMG